MKGIKNMNNNINSKTNITENLATVKGAVDTIEASIDALEFIGSIKNPTEEVLFFAGNILLEIGKLMDNCERALDKTLLLFSSASKEDFDAVDVNTLLEEYIIVSHNYLNVKKKAESTIMDEAYLKTIFNQNT